MNILPGLAALTLLAGCSTPPQIPQSRSLTAAQPIKMLDNLMACTLARDAAVVVSMWGPFGIAAYIRSADAAVACATQP
jgi:starvation-inducible outer membrane lipoprotein